jgi:hypothetical protein
VAFTKPATTFSSVDFPQPDGPISDVKEPGLKSRDVDETATMSPPAGL